MHIVRSLVLLAVAGTAVYTDVRGRRIPNWLTYGGIGVALGIAALSGRFALAAAAGGALIFALPLLAAWLAGWLGAGDVKLAAVLGALLGLPAAMPALVGGAALGALCAAILVGVAVAPRVPDLWAVFRQDPLAAFRQLGREPVWGASHPYGAYLSVASLLVFFLIPSPGGVGL